MSADELLQRQNLERWVATYSQKQGRPPFVSEAATALRLTEPAIGGLVADSADLYLAHPGRRLGAQTIELEEA